MLLSTLIFLHNIQQKKKEWNNNFLLLLFSSLFFHFLFSFLPEMLTKPELKFLIKI